MDKRKESNLCYIGCEVIDISSKSEELKPQLSYKIVYTLLTCFASYIVEDM